MIDATEREWLEWVADAETGAPVAAGGGAVPRQSDAAFASWPIELRLLGRVALFTFAWLLWVGASYVTDWFGTRFSSDAALAWWWMPKLFQLCIAITLLVLVLNVLVVTGVEQYHRARRFFRLRGARTPATPPGEKV